MEKFQDHFDKASITVILITFILFVAALFVKGFTHDLLLEAGVFLVSVKLIISQYKSSIQVRTIRQDLAEVKEMTKEYCAR